MARRPKGSNIDLKRRARYLKNREAALAYAKKHHAENREEHNKQMLAHYHATKTLKGRNKNEKRT